MQFSEPILQMAAGSGSKNVASALSKLSGENVKVATSKVDNLPMSKAAEYLKPKAEHSVVVHAQLLSGVKGASFLIMTRENSLALIDLLNHQAVGTTGILKDIDRSALKETLNILSNAYMTALSEAAHLKIGMDIPNMVTASRLEDIIAYLATNPGPSTESVIIFETTITIRETVVTASLYLLFNEAVVSALNKA